MKLEVGKLYVCEKYHMMLCPDQETAAAAVAECAAVFVTISSSAATFWSNRLGKPVLFSAKNIPLLVLHNKEEYIEVLIGDKKGWIIYADCLKIKEIDYA